MLERNQVYCMDALELLRQLDDASVDCIVTDPPYGAGKVSAWRSADERFDEIVGNDQVCLDWLADGYRVVASTGAMYIFAKWQNVDEWKAGIKATGFHVRNLIVWDKMQHGTGDLETCYAPQYELILFCVKGRHILRGRRPIDIIRHPKVQPQLLHHPYEKPVGLLERLVLKSTDAGGLVVDPFAGSGTTLVAARNLGRDYIGGDISPEYVELARRRLSLPYTLPMFEAVKP